MDIPKALEKLKVAAKVSYEANRMWAAFNGDGPGRLWDQISSGEQETYLRTIYDARSKGWDMRATHEAWLDTKLVSGWRYGDGKRDDGIKTHPCMRIFDKLAEKDQRKDHMFLSMIHSMLGQDVIDALKPYYEPVEVAIKEAVEEAQAAKAATPTEVPQPPQAEATA